MNAVGLFGALFFSLSVAYGQLPNLEPEVCLNLKAQCSEEAIRNLCPATCEPAMCINLKGDCAEEAIKKLCPKTCALSSNVEPTEPAMCINLKGDCAEEAIKKLCPKTCASSTNVGPPDPPVCPDLKPQCSTNEAVKKLCPKTCGTQVTPGNVEPQSACPTKCAACSSWTWSSTQGCMCQSCGSGGGGTGGQVEGMDTCTDKCMNKQNCEGWKWNSVQGCLCEKCHPVLVNGVNAAQKQQFVDLHNKFRSQVALGQTNQPPASDMTRMSWDDNLAAMAQQWAEKCTSMHPQNVPYGQNIADHFSIDGTVAAWFNEINLYNYNTQYCSGTCGHYTQVVWAASTKVGCGIARCKNAGIQNYAIVCNYLPAGNMNSRRPYVLGAACSTCPSGFGTCNAGLCS